MKTKFHTNWLTNTSILCTVEDAERGMYSLKATCRRHGSSVKLGRTVVSRPEWHVTPDGYDDPIAIVPTAGQAKAAARKHLSERFKTRYGTSDGGSK